MAKSSLLDSAKRARDLAKSKTAGTKPTKASVTSNVVQLPLWPEPVRAAPNVTLRSALFAALGKNTERPYLSRAVIAAYGEDVIGYTGIRLDQWHFSLWAIYAHPPKM